MIKLPPIMIGADLQRLLGLCRDIVECDGTSIDCDAADLITAEPVAICLLAATFAGLEREGRRAIVRNLPSRVRDYLIRLNVLSSWLELAPEVLGGSSSEVEPPIQAARVRNSSQANAVGNAVTRAIAAFIPLEDLATVLEDDAALRRYRLVEQPLGYLVTELLDNALNHARAGGFAHSSAWLAAQYYPQGDLIRLCVMDDGCGFLRSLREHPEVKPRTDAVAIQKAFLPSISSKRDVRLFRDSAHQGMGLTVCRDICMQAGGHIDVASGGAWVRNSGASNEAATQLTRHHQGAIVNLTLHRRTLTPGIVARILDRYQPDETLPVTFV